MKDHFLYGNEQQGVFTTYRVEVIRGREHFYLAEGHTLSSVERERQNVIRDHKAFCEANGVDPNNDTVRIVRCTTTLNVVE